MTGDTIRDVKKRLAAAFPSVVFTYGKAGRGRQRGHAVEWTGGPAAEAVQAAAAYRPAWKRHGRSGERLYTRRSMTPEEEAAWRAEKDREWSAWEAGAGERAAARAAQATENRRLGAVKAKATRARNAAREATLIDLCKRWPGVEWDSNGDWLHWRDGPLEEDVTAVLPDGLWRFLRRQGTLLPCRAPQRDGGTAANRQERRAAKAVTRAAAVARGIARRWLAYADPACRRNHLSAQPPLPLDLPRATHRGGRP